MDSFHVLHSLDYSIIFQRKITNHPTTKFHPLQFSSERSRCDRNSCPLAPNFSGVHYHLKFFLAHSGSPELRGKLTDPFIKHHQLQFKRNFLRNFSVIRARNNEVGVEFTLVVNTL